MKQAASRAMAILLTAILLWGGCLFCVQAKSCCDPAGGCKQAKSRTTAQVGCSTQAFSETKAPSSPQPLPQVAELASPVRGPVVDVLQTVAWTPQRPDPPPDLNLLHSIFRI